MKVISIGVDSGEIEALKRLVELVAKTDESAELVLKALPLLTNLQATYDVALTNEEVKHSSKRRTNKGDLENLQVTIEKQRWQISGLMVQAMLSKQFTFLAGQNNTAVTVSLLSDPKPARLRCINNGDFEISPFNVIAIKAKGKSKILYLRKSITPKLSSTKRTSIEVRSGFDELIKKIQPQLPSFLRVHDSYIINLRDYRLLRTGVFTLKSESLKDSVYDPIRRIETDFRFKVEEYGRILKSIEANDEYIAEFQASKTAMEKVNNQMEYFNNKYGNKPNN